LVWEPHEPLVLECTPIGFVLGSLCPKRAFPALSYCLELLRPKSQMIGRWNGSYGADLRDDDFRRSHGQRQDGFAHQTKPPASFKKAASSSFPGQKRAMVPLQAADLAQQFGQTSMVGFTRTCNTPDSPFALHANPPFVESAISSGGLCPQSWLPVMRPDTPTTLEATTGQY